MIKLLIMKFFYPVTSSLLGPNILLNTLFSNTLSLRSSLNVSDQVSHPYKTTGKIIVLHLKSQLITTIFSITLILILLPLIVKNALLIDYHCVIITNPYKARFIAPVQTGHGAHTASYTMGTGSFPGVKRPGRGVKHPLPPSAEVKERADLYL
jgi:hypothetical protein